MYLNYNELLCKLLAILFSALAAVEQEVIEVRELVLAAFGNVLNWMEFLSKCETSVVCL